MSFKDRLFGPPWEHKDADVRARAVGESDHPELRERLPALALEDDDAAVRLAALKRLDHEPVWLKASAADPDPEIRRHANEVLLRRVTHTPADDVQARLDWLERIETTETLRTIARNGSDTELRAAAIGKIPTQGFLGDCFIDEPDDDLAGRILAKIDQLSTLERIIDRLRRTSKARHRAAAERLAAVRAEQGDDRGRDLPALEVVERIEALARGEQLAERASRLAELQSAWQALVDAPADPPAELERRFRGAEKIVTAAMQPRPAEPETPPEAAGEPEPSPELEAIAERMRELASQPIAKKTGSTFKRTVSEWDRLFGRIAEPSGPELRLKDEFMALAAEIRARLEAEQARPEPEAKAEDAPAAAEQLDPAELENLMDEVAAAIETGDIATAHGALGRARSYHDRLPRKQQPRAAAGRLQRLAGRFKELRDWQHWSNNKLRERLIEQAEELDAGQLHPDAITERLKEIRARWQSLEDQEVLPGDRRKFAAPPGQWRRFQAACRKAFESAKPYLEQRHAVQEQELEALQAFLKDADGVRADQTADTETLTRYQRAARQAIRNLDTLPPKKRGAMARRLRDLMDGISERLEAGFNAIEEEKRRLIAEARKLTHETDRKQAIERAKALQAQWKKAGATRRKHENELWKEFREPIDPLFEDLKQEQKQRKQADQELKAELKALCHKAEELAGLPDDELAGATGAMAGLVDEWKSRRVPMAGLRERFDKARARFDQRLRDLQVRREQAALDHLEKLAGRLQQTWQERLDGNTDFGADGGEQVDASDPVEAELRRRLEAFTAAHADADELQARVAEFTEAAHQVVIEMEFLAGLESPAEDKRRRMEYQIQRLSNRLGKGAPKPDLTRERADLARRRLESFPRDPAVHAALEKRYAAADKIIQGMVSTQ